MNKLRVLAELSQKLIRSGKKVTSKKIVIEVEKLWRRRFPNYPLSKILLNLGPRIIAKQKGFRAELQVLSKQAQLKYGYRLLMQAVRSRIRNGLSVKMAIIRELEENRRNQGIVYRRKMQLYNLVAENRGLLYE